MTDESRKGAGEQVPVGQLRFDWPRTVPTTEEPPAPAAVTASSIHESPPEASPPAAEPDGSVETEPVSAEGPVYRPGHPWHYYPEGDNAPPVPFDAIPASESAARALAKDLPKSPAKRLVKVRDLLESERGELAEAGVRYQEVIERGAEALSNYDRTIAYGGNDELARAATIALLYNQISWRRGRLLWLEKENAREGWLKR